jgi:uncharacterized membrane protein (DUF2068 family)
VSIPPGTQPSRRRFELDWELIGCGLHGHALFGTDAAHLRPGDRHIACEAGGVRWYRCLRCDAWLALPGPAQPAREHPPNRDEIDVPLRGQALRDRFVLRLIAVDRTFHFLILGLLGVAVLLFAADRHSLRDAFFRVLTDLQGGVAGGPVQNTGHVGILRELDKLFTLRSGTLKAVGFALVGYALLEGVEAVGLWLAKRWAEYLTFISTTVLLPLEIYELIHRSTVLKVIGFVINLAVVLYLLFAKRLFGLRGGAAAVQAERDHGMSWETIEDATLASASPGESDVEPEPGA